MKRPSFQFYPQDWLSDPNVMAMTDRERGAYIQLIATMWTTDDCSLRNDEEYLSKLANTDKVVIRSLLPCFKVVNNTLRHKRLDEERLKQDDYRKACSDAGKKGMKKRWKKAKQSEPDKVVITKDNSSTSTSTSTSNNNTISRQKIFSDDVKKLSDFLFTLIKENNEGFKGDPRKWDDDFDKLLRIDQRPYEEAARLIQLTQQDSFWKSNILSGKKFREKYDQLLMKLSTQSTSNLAFIS